MSTILYLVIPCYNEQEVLPETAKRLKQAMQGYIADGRISQQSRICFVNDGSKDQTWPMIQALHQQDPLFAGINLSRNRGHQNALLAGLMTVKNDCDCAISMDADLQDGIGVIDSFLTEFHNGFDVVYGVRSSRETDSAFKRMTAQGFYRFMSLMGVESVYNHADCRLMSRRALDALGQYKEVNLFLRGMVPLIGFPSTSVTYERSKRFAGESKYPLSKMIALAINGITSMSVKPIRFIAMLGLLIFLISIIILIVILFQKIFGFTVAGWTSLIATILLLGGLQMLALGIIGEYVGKIYEEVKQRPRFLVESYVNTTQTKEE